MNLQERLYFSLLSVDFEAFERLAVRHAPLPSDLLLNLPFIGSWESVADKDRCERQRLSPPPLGFSFLLS